MPPTARRHDWRAIEDDERDAAKLAAAAGLARTESLRLATLLDEIGQAVRRGDLDPRSHLRRAAMRIAEQLTRPPAHGGPLGRAGGER